jgi:nucleotide-binding universal stress UspA family protein
MASLGAFGEKWMDSKKFLVATDFSTRSDRALRRGTLLAQQLGATLTLLHVVDDDQPRRLIKAERTAAAAILKEHVRTLKQGDGLACDARIAEGDAFAGITLAAEELDVDLVVIGPHRRQLLRDVFIGTTAERTISASRRPVLMANGVPAGSYRHVLTATDLSPCSADALRALRRLGIEAGMAVSVMHVFDAVGTSLLTRGAVSEDSIKDFLDEEEVRAARDLDRFLAEAGFEPVRRIVRHNDSSTADVIVKAAREESADLLVVGTRSRAGIARFLLGSVAQEVLRTATIDVLAVPPDGDA